MELEKFKPYILDYISRLSIEIEEEKYQYILEDIIDSILKKVTKTINIDNDRKLIIFGEKSFELLNYNSKVLFLFNNVYEFKNETHSKYDIFLIDDDKTYSIVSSYIEYFYSRDKCCNYPDYFLDVRILVFLNF